MLASGHQLLQEAGTSWYATRAKKLNNFAANIHLATRINILCIPWRSRLVASKIYAGYHGEG